MTNDLIGRSELLKKAIRVSEFDEGGWERILRAVPVEEIEAAEAVAGDLIEELAGVKEQLAGMETMLTSAQSAAETWKRRAEAAVDDIELGICCETCKHDNDDDEKLFCRGCVRITSRGNWEWRGVKSDEPSEEL